MRRFVTLPLAVLFWVGTSAMATAPAATLRAPMAAPGGFGTQETKQLAPGVEYRVFASETPKWLAHVATIDRTAKVSLRPVLSNDLIAGPEPRMERTSSMCIRVSCIVAVNGDFFFPQTGLPVGALVSAGIPSRSPSEFHHQLRIGDDKGLSAGPLSFRVLIATSDLDQLTLSGINLDRNENAIVLYTPHWGSSTLTNHFGFEMNARVIKPPVPLRLGQTVLIRVEDAAGGVGNAPIANDGFVLSGHGTGAQALQDLWARMQAGDLSRELLLRVESDPSVTDSIGGTPILVHEGKRWFQDRADPLYAGRHPRTAVGWNDKEIFLVVIDGRQPRYSVGMTMKETADFMIALGAVEAINLDGGGSSTFVVAGGAVLNSPSDRAVRSSGKEQIVHVPGRGDRVMGNVERPVAVGLAVVQGTFGAPVSVAPLDGMELPRALALPAPHVDPGSDPTGGTPALVTTGDSSSYTYSALVTLALVLTLAVAAGLFLALRAARSR